MNRLTVAHSDIEVRLRPGETILGGLRRAGYAARTGCRRGGCGVCKVEVAEGSVTYPETVADTVLTPQERAAGICLICRAVPDGDTVIAPRPEFALRCVAPFLAALAKA